MFNRSKYVNLLKILIILLILAIIGILAVIGYKSYNSYYVLAGAREAIAIFEEAIKNEDTSSKITTKYKEFTVIGIIEIPSIDLKYPILQENTVEALETSVVLMYTSQGLNKIGNSVITGHNYRNNIMFSKLNELKIGEYIYITNDAGEKIRYQIYNIYEVDENENSYITRNIDGKKEISLSTITDDSKLKTIVLAKEK